MTLSAIVCLSSIAVIVILFNRKHFELNLMLAYAICCLLYHASMAFISIFYLEALQEIEWIIQNVFLLIEFIMLTLFIRTHLANDHHLRAMLLFLQVFPLAVCYSWLYNNSLHQPQSFTTLTGSLLLVTGCLLFYREIIQEPPDTSVNNPIPFVVISGIFILSAVTFAMSASFSGSDDNMIHSVVHLVRCTTHLILFILLFALLKWRNNFLSSFPA